MMGRLGQAPLGPSPPRRCGKLPSRSGRGGPFKVRASSGREKATQREAACSIYLVRHRCGGPRIDRLGELLAGILVGRLIGIFIYWRITEFFGVIRRTPHPRDTHSSPCERQSEIGQAPPQPCWVSGSSQDPEPFRYRSTLFATKSVINAVEFHVRYQEQDQAICNSPEWTPSRL
jgi:hypothetical protein